VEPGVNHIIGKQIIDMKFETISDGVAWQASMTEMFYQKLLPEMEKLFDKFSTDNSVISFDRLSIDCGLLSPKHWEEECVTIVLHDLQQELLAANKTIIANLSATASKFPAMLLFYIGHGYLPWNGNIASLSVLEKTVMDNEFVRKLKAVINADAKAAIRLIDSFSKSFVDKIIQRLVSENEIFMDKSVVMNRTDSYVGESHSSTAQILERLCQLEVPAQLFRKEITTSPERFLRPGANLDSIEESYLNEADEIYISNAGLILLHPFLEPLLESCNLIKEKQWCDGAISQHYALNLLKYLAYGIDDTNELNPVLSRLLCGIEADDTTQSGLVMNEDHRNECDSMLTEVIAHWKTLKNTGLEAFRETFLRRNGKLTGANKGWRLQVEQKGVDVLLSHIPWGFGIVKLPWMNEIIYTEWC
jgi:hypothetical protein